MNLAQWTRSLFARKPAVRKTPTRSFRPQLECLSERIMPAVTASVSMGVLTVKAVGAAADDKVTIAPVAPFAGRFSVTGANVTVVNNVANGVFDAVGVTSMKFDLGEGFDHVEMDNVILAGGISFLGGNGASILDLDNCIIGGSIGVTNLTNTAGTDVIEIRNSTINGSVTVNGGMGPTDGQFTNVNILGSLKYTSTSNVLIPDNDSIRAFGLNVGGSIALALGNGTNNFLTTINPLEVGGGFSYAGGSGTDTVIISAGATFGAAATIAMGDNTNSLRVDGGAALFVGTTLTVTGGADGDSINLGSTQISRVGGAASFKLGDGTNTFQTSGLRVGSLGLTNGSGNDTATIDNLTVAAGFAFLGGNGANKLDLDHSVIGGSVAVTNLTNAAGEDVTLLSNTTINGSLTVNAGLGNTNTQFDQVNILGSFKFVSASSTLIPGADTVLASGLFVGGSVALALANGDNQFTGSAAPIEVGGSFTYIGGTDSDRATFQSNSIIGASATFAMGEGLNILTVSGANGLFVGAKLSWTGGAGEDFITLGSAAFTRVAGAASFNLGNGTNTFITSGLRVGSLGLLTGTGNDTGTFDNLTVAGAAALNFGAGTNTVKLASTANSTSPSTIGGALTLTTGAGADTIKVGFNGDFHVGGAAKFILGTTVLDNGNDDLQINDAMFASFLSILTGTGNDIVRIGDLLSVSIAGKLFVNANAGGDQLFLGTFNDPSKVVRLLVVPALVGGTGGDSVRIFPQILGGNVQGPPGVVVLPTPAALLAAGWEGIV